jgi:hypothetical protein
MISILRPVLILALACTSITPLLANDLRLWTSRKGSSIEAKLLKLDDGKVHLVTAETKVIKVDVDDLSLADRQHLVEFAKADPKIISETPLGIPEKEVRISSKDFTRLKEKLSLPGLTEGDFDLLETEHFLIGVHGKVRSQGLAEMAERLWHGMAFQHMNFREDWGDQRMLVLATSDEDFHKSVGEWYVKSLTARGKADQANHMSQVWNRAASTGMRFPDDLMEKYKVFVDGRMFHARNTSTYSKAFGPFPTHSLASTILNHQLGGVSGFGAEGYFTITTGHAYYKEIQLAGKTETTLLNKGDYEDDEIGSARGFDDGTSWARTLKKMVRKGDVVPNLSKMLKWEGKDLTPERLVTIYSFAYYLQTTPQRMTAFATLVRRIETSDQVPPPEEIAKIYGFESAEAMEEDWITFVKSTKFK